MFLKTQDADLFITAFGNGPRTFVAHGGWVGSGELWQLPFEALSRTWRTVSYDHRGTGATANRAERITFELLVQDLFRVLDALAIDKCVLAGESSGASVVLEAALRQPHRFTGLVIVDGRYATGRGATTSRIEACKANFEATMDAFVKGCIPEEDCEAERRWAKRIVMRSDAASAVQLLELMDDVDVEARLEQLTMPTLILHGTRDLITPIAVSEELARKLPNNRFVKIEGAGHVPTMTRPDAVVQAIAQYFD